ncbi:MAG: hypothetical protein KAT74_01900 [Candidatus Cloacimonetes bacterium]|nr:hypothetical protein [Candidatus Cloacimonadota bacterium]
MLKKLKKDIKRKNFSININILNEIKKIAQIKKIHYLELINQVLINFIMNYKAIDSLKRKGKSTATESDDEKYLEYLDSLRKLLTDSSIPKKSKKFLIG